MGALRMCDRLDITGSPGLCEGQVPGVTVM